MIKQLRKVGNSRALLLDKAILELIGVDDKGTVQLTVDAGSLIITPVHPRVLDNARFQSCLDRAVRSRRETLRRLAQ